ncbi:MAG: VWA domain-containing protein [Bacteroidia bacterium]
MLIFACLQPIVLRAQTDNKPTTRVLFMFDASFSMFGTWKTGIKIDIAKRLLSQFLDSLQGRDHLQIALRVYGAQYALEPVRNCHDTKLMVPFGGDNIPAIKKAIDNIEPKGTTPIAYSLEQCGNDFPPRDNCRNIVILITDGIEECDGDPCAVSLALQKKGIILKPFIIGIGANEDFGKAFDCVGTFYQVTNEANFTNILNIVISQALDNTTAQVNLLDIKGKPTETNTDMTFYDQVSGQIKYNYIHTINARGNPDTIPLDPLVKYHLVVHTIPEVEKSDITLTPGKHNIIALDAPQGYLYLAIDGYNNYNVLQTIVRKKSDMNTLNIQAFNTSEKYIVGKYDLEILTLPRTYINDVKISESTTTTVQIPQAGSVTILKPSAGPGSIYLENNGTLAWVCNLIENQTQQTIVLQPGHYRLEFRAREATQCIYSIEKTFKIDSGSSTQVQLY